MAALPKIRTVVRLVTWPVVLIVALNIENIASQAGYNTFINRHWRDSIPVLSNLYDFAASPWVIYPALLMFGAGVYERILRTVERAETPGGKFQRWVIKWKADVLASAFFKKGYFRKQVTAQHEIEKMNRRLAACGLAVIPDGFSENEELNRVYGSYLALLSKGQFEHAQEFIAAKADFIRTIA